MCGICGELRFDGGPVDPAAIGKMTSLLAHRGPDDADMWSEGAVGLGFRRLAIIDLSERGRQPMWSEDRRLAIVFNGELYNFAEIRKELETRGYRFRSGSDTEVLLNAIHCWGLESAVSRFIGMFAFAVWDAQSRTLQLCRDRAGIKPLYYQVGRDGLLFASELKALYAHRSFRRELTDEGVGQYFVLGYTAGETTVYRDTFKLLPGHTVRVSADGTIERRRYWSIDDIEPGSYTGSFEQASEELAALAESAFGYRLVSDVPVGLFLSGGVDSSYLAAVLKHRLHADLLHITIGFRESRVDEAPKAAAVAKQLGVQHVVRYLETPDAGAALRQFIETYDEPFSDTSGIPMSLVSKVAREHVKVALSADGGDEQFCGYESYDKYARHYLSMRSYAPALRRAASVALRRLVPYAPLLSAAAIWNGGRARNPQIIARYEKFTELLRIDTLPDMLALMNSKGWLPGAVRDLVRGGAAGAMAGTPVAAARDASTREDIIETMMRTDYTLFLRDDILAKTDRASMAASLECRDPMLDHRLAEFAYRLPLDFVLRGAETKRILKHQLRAWVDPAIVDAPKQGFTVPLYEWMRGAWRPLVEEFLSPAAIRRVGVLDEKTARAEVDRFYRWRGARAERVLMMLTFQMWAHRWHAQPAS